MIDNQAPRSTAVRWTSNLHLDGVIALSFGLASSALYAFTAAPSVATLFDDSLEFHVVLPTLGIAHPSGYPLYTLLGKLFTLLLPFRDPAGRINLLSAFCAGVAVGVLYLLTRRLVGNRTAAAVTTAIFALSPGWWSQATVAEVYALHGLFVALFLYLLLRWEETSHKITNRKSQIADPGLQLTSLPIYQSTSLPISNLQPPTSNLQPPTSNFQPPASNDRWLAAAAFTFGLGLTHHRMIALLLPAALVFIFWTDPGLLRPSKRWILPLVLGLAPLLLYLYLPIHGQRVGSLDGTYVPTLAGTVNWILARSYGVFLTGNPFAIQRSTSTVIALFLAQLGGLTILASIVGVVTAWRFNRRRYVFLLLATVTQIAFASAYKVEDVIVFFLPAFMLACVWAAWGLAPLFDSTALHAVNAARRLKPAPWLRSLIVAAWTFSLVGIMLFEPVRSALHPSAEQNRWAAWEFYDYGQDMIANVAPGGQVIGLLGETTLVRYFRDVLGQRPDVGVVPADAESARFAAVDAALAAGKPTYLTRDLPGAAGRYSLSAAGPLIAVAPKASPAPPPSGRAIGAGIVLVNAQTEVRHPHAGPTVRLTLTWSAAEPIREDLKISARLVDAAGKAVTQNDGVPVHYTYPTTAWVPGERVVDVYDLPLPPAAPEGTYGILVILYRAADGSEVGRTNLPPVLVQR